MFHGHLRKYVFYCCQVECSINVNQILMVNHIIELFCMFDDFLSSCFINCCERGAKVSKCNCRFLCFSVLLQLCCLVHYTFKKLSLNGFYFPDTSLLGSRPSWTTFLPCSGLPNGLVTEQEEIKEARKEGKKEGRKKKGRRKNGQINLFFKLSTTSLSPQTLPYQEQ